MAWRAGFATALRSYGGAITSYVRANPAEAGAIVLVVLVAVGVLAWGLRRYFRSTGETFRRVLADRDSVTVLLHPNPDPDAMAAGIGVARLAESVDTPATIRFPGEIRHQENRAFRTVLDLELEVIESPGDLDGDGVVLIDHNQPRGFDGADTLRPFAVIDHHPGSGTGHSFTDVRPEYGACSTIVTEYLRSTGFDPVDDPVNGQSVDGVIDPALATGLMFGILSDTNHLTTGCSPAEFELARYLYPGVDDDLLDRIGHPQVDAEILDVKSRAIDNRVVNGPFAVSNVGTVENLDAISQAADELMRLEGVTADVVGGRKNGTLHLSGRSRDDRLHMGRALERAVEDIPQSSAGGHARMAGGQVSVPHMDGLDPDTTRVEEGFTERLFRSMKGEEVIEPV
ncbi:MAG: bifunctional oligoribonuclease/PAP phosphatase NrnA [Halodesulfurarchaeum sp.]